MTERHITIEMATPDSVAPYGAFVGVVPTQPLFAEWLGVKVYGKVPIEIGTGGELLHVVMDSRVFPVSVELVECHPHHNQTYLPANGRPFVMVLGHETQDGLPDIPTLRAFLFSDGAGIAMHKNIWHEFPIALENDTRFTVILRQEAHVNLLDSPEQPNDARGPDLVRFDVAARVRVMLHF